MKLAVHRTSVGLFLLVLISNACSQPRSVSLVNTSHLERLMEKIYLNGREVSIVHIYSDYPSYRWTDAGDEGIACVDDAARAAVLFLRKYELTRDSSALARAKSLLGFVLVMQADDGQFYNFIRSDHTINRTGKTSLQSFGWWAGRAVWSMALGYRIMRSADPHFAESLREALRKSLPHVGRALDSYGRTEMVKGFSVPLWLLYESGSDATSELMLGLIEYYRVTHSPAVAGYIQKLAHGMMMMQDGDISTFPFGAHRSWRTMWHSWGNSQTDALASAGIILRDSVMVASAEREARGFYSRLLIEGMLKQWDFAEPSEKAAYEQIAYDIRPMTLGLLKLYDATRNDLYLKMAGLATSWFFGNNVPGVVMYDVNTGRCFDGITDSTRINRNSGAESTIEALYTLMEVEQYPEARRYLNVRKHSVRTTAEELAGTFVDDGGTTVELAVDLKTGNVEVRDDPGN